MISISTNFIRTVVPDLTINTCPGLFVSPIYSFGGGGNSGIDVDVLRSEGADARLLLIGQADRYGAAARLGVTAEVICPDDLAQPTPEEARAIVYVLNTYAYTAQPGIDRLLDRLRVIAGLPSDTEVNERAARAERTDVVDATQDHTPDRMPRITRMKTHNYSTEVENTQRALIASFRPFGSLHESYDVSMTRVADLMIVYATSGAAQAAFDLLLLLQGASCERCCAVTFGRGVVTLTTPTSATAISVSSSFRGTEVCVDFGAPGSVYRAAQIVESDDSVEWSITACEQDLTTLPQ